MKKTFSIILFMCLATVIANAQWKVASVEKGEPYTKLLQVIDTDNSTLVYATLERSCDDFHLSNLNRGTYVKANGMKYKILNSVNLPLSDDADKRYARLNKGNNEINFVMEFEKFPAKDGFDIVENDSKEGEYNFSFKGVTVSPIEATEVIDTKRFLDSGTPVFNGIYAKDGVFYLYYIKDGLCITCNAVAQNGGLSGNDELFYLDIVNDSDHGVMFDFDKVGVVGNKKKGNDVDSKGWVKYTPSSYDDYLLKLDYDEARYKTYGVINIVGDQIDREKYKTEYGTWDRVGMEALSALKDQAIENRINQYMSQHPKSHPSALKSQSIASGDAAHGYIAAKKKNADEVVLIIPMDNYNFEFTFALK